MALTTNQLYNKLVAEGSITLRGDEHEIELIIRRLSKLRSRTRAKLKDTPELLDNKVLKTTWDEPAILEGDKAKAVISLVNRGKEIGVEVL